MKKRFFLLSVMIAALFVLAASLSSCASGEEGEGVPDTPKKPDGGYNIPAGWWSGAFECTVELSDGTGTEPVAFTLTRDGDVRVAALTAPASMAGVSVAISPEGNHIICGEHDVYVSDEGAAGLKLLFDALTYDASALSFGENGTASFSIASGGRDAAVTLTLGESGTPSAMSVTAGGYRRDAAITNFVMK